MVTDAVAINSFVSPYNELIALECLYSEDGATLKRVTSETVHSGKLPSEALQERYGLFKNDDSIAQVKRLVDTKIGSFSVVVNNTPNWPAKLADSARPTPLLYYNGFLNLIETKSVSVVGSRKASDSGRGRARRIARELSKNGVTVVTGLARGIDTEATTAAIQAGGPVIGVIGTPIDEAYPKENTELQTLVAKNYLLLSQVPFFRYATEPFSSHRIHFPERNELMAAVSDATVIVEASDTSGTLSQARACLHQGRPLFIMRSLIDNPLVTWPEKFLAKDNVFVLDNTEQVLQAIGVQHD